MNNSLASLVTSSTLFIGSLIMMFVTNWIMAITAVCATIFGFMMMGIILKKSQKYFVQRQVELGDLNGHIEEIYSGHNVVKAYNGDKEALEEFNRLNDRLYECNRKSQFLSGIMQPIMGFVGNFGYVAVCVVGALLTMNNVISFGMDKIIKKKCIKFLGIGEKSTVLDLCTGTGDLVKIIQALRPKTGITAVDFSKNMLAIANGRPETMSLKQIIKANVDFQYEVNTRKYTNLLAKELERKEIQEGLIKACNVIDLIIEILRGSKDRNMAKACLVEGKIDGIKFKSKESKIMATQLAFTEKQANAILEMRNDASMHIDKMDTLEMLQLINRENMNSIMAVEAALEKISIVEGVIFEPSHFPKNIATELLITIPQTEPKISDILYNICVYF